MRRLIALSHASLSGSVDVQPPGPKVIVDPSMCRQVKRNFTTTVLGDALAYRLVFFLCSSRSSERGSLILPHFRAIAEPARTRSTLWATYLGDLEDGRASNNGCAVELHMQAVWLHFLNLLQILLQYYYESRKRRGFEYHMASR